MNFTPAIASPLTEKKRRSVFTVCGTEIDERDVIIEGGGVVVIEEVNEDYGNVYPRLMKADECFATYREALTAALKRAHEDVTRANAKVNLLIARVNAS